MNNYSVDILLSERMRKEYPANNYSLAKRKSILGVGINDATYITDTKIEGVRVTCKAYKSWMHMLTRVYSKKYLIKQPSYTGVTVCDEWLIFSNFRKWWLDNYIDNYQLDKDILSMDSKVYSPDTCIYIPRWLNCFITNNLRGRGSSKIGTSWVEDSNKFKAQCNNPKTTTTEYLGLFDTEEEAHQVWKDKKLKYALELKSEMDAIDLRIYPNVVEIVKNMK